MLRKRLFTLLVLFECATLLQFSHGSDGRAAEASALQEHGPRWRTRGIAPARLGAFSIGLELRLRGGGKYARRKARLSVGGEVLVGKGVEKPTRRPARGDGDGDEAMSDGETEFRKSLGKAPKRSTAMLPPPPPPSAWKRAGRQRTKPPAPRPRIVVDGSNVIKSGGQGVRIELLESLIPDVCRYFGVSPNEVLVIIDGWVASAMGEQAMRKLRGCGASIRASRMGVSADARILQSASSLGAIIVSNDAYLDYCPRKAAPHARNKKSCVVADKGGDDAPLEMASMDLAPADSHLVSPHEWEWASAHSYRFAPAGDRGRGWSFFASPRTERARTSGVESGDPAACRAMNADAAPPSWDADAGGHTDLPDLAAMTLKEEQEVERLRCKREAVEKANAGEDAESGGSAMGIHGHQQQQQQQHRKQQGAKSKMSGRRLQKMMKEVDECMGVKRGKRHKHGIKAKTKGLAPLRGGGEEDCLLAASRTLSPKPWDCLLAASRTLNPKPWDCLLAASQAEFRATWSRRFRELEMVAAASAPAPAVAIFAAASAASLIGFRGGLRGGSATDASRHDPALPQSQITRGGDRDGIVMIGSCAVPIKVPREKKSRARNRHKATDPDGRASSPAILPQEPHICTRCGRIVNASSLSLKEPQTWECVQADEPCAFTCLSGELARLHALPTPELRRAYRHGMNLRDQAISRPTNASRFQVAGHWGGSRAHQYASWDSRLATTLIPLTAYPSRGPSGSGSKPRKPQQPKNTTAGRARQAIPGSTSEESRLVREFTMRYAARIEAEEEVYGGVESLRELEDALLEQELLERYDKGSVDAGRAGVLDKVRQMVGKGGCDGADVRGLFNALEEKRRQELERAANKIKERRRRRREKMREEQGLDGGGEHHHHHHHHHGGGGDDDDDEDGEGEHAAAIGASSRGKRGGRGSKVGGGRGATNGWGRVIVRGGGGRSRGRAQRSRGGDRGRGQSRRGNFRGK